MGGGDLNQKKSWHPSTSKNIERVQKAEDKDAKERKRIAELKKEIDEEREQESLVKIGQDSGVLKKDDNVKLDWMYKGPSALVNRDEYLLGRSIDKSFELLQQSEMPSSSMINSIEYDCTPVSIFATRGGNEQVDMERKLQEDPLILIRKQETESIKKIVTNPIKMKQLQKLADMGRSKKKKTEDMTETELDCLLLEKLNRMEKIQSKSHSDWDDGDEKHSKSQRRHKSKSREHHHLSRSRSPPNKPTFSKPSYTKQVRTKLSEDEMEKKRKAMMDNAKWREEQRSSSIKKRDQIEKQVEDRDKKHKVSDGSFIRKQLSNTAEKSTVAERVKSNIYNIQRSKSDMNTNFARR